jgi:hypothetical protein
VEPESKLKLNVTCTAPGFGVIDPLKPTAEPTAIEEGDLVSEIEVDKKKFAVSVTGPFMVTDGHDPEHEPDPTPVHPTNE